MIPRIFNHSLCVIVWTPEIFEQSCSFWLRLASDSQLIAEASAISQCYCLFFFGEA